MATYIKKDFASPNGPILLLSAKGSTTASIAEANGVKDFSGNGNHGQAFGGVTVLDGGDGFAFDGTNGRIMILRNFGISNTRFCTMSIRFKMTNNPSSLVIAWFGPSNETRAIIGVFTSNNIFYINVNKNERAINNFYPLLNKEYHLVVVADDSKARLYVDGEMIQELEIVYTEYVAGRLGIGARINDTTASSFSYPFCGNIRDFHIYPRALSAAEVKYLYNGFQPNIIIGQTIPSGTILDLSARGLSTEGIAQANGVVDRSGNGNHGQAYNGVAVVNDDDMGSCFSFDGSNDVIAIGSNNLSSYFNDMEEMSLSLLFRVNAVNTGSQYLVSFKTQLSESNQLWLCLWIESSTRKISFSGRWKESDWGNPWTGNDNFLTADLGTVYHATVVCDFKNGIFKAYVNGVLVQTTDNLRAGNLRALYAGNNVFFGALNDTPQYGLNCSLADIRIYPRALTASEVQQLADASLKKIINIKSGSSDVRQIFSNGEMIYAKTNDYSLNL